MTRSILFIIDETEKKYFEFNDLVTNFWLIREFLKRNYKVSISIKSDLFIENAKTYIYANKSFLENENIYYEKKQIKYLVFVVYWFLC